MKEPRDRNSTCEAAWPWKRGIKTRVTRCLGAGQDLPDSLAQTSSAPLYIYENKAAMSFGMSELQFSGQNQAAILLKTKAQCKSYSKLRCHALSMN